MKLNYKRILKIICIIVVLVLILIPTSNVFGAINPNNSEDTDSMDSFKDFLFWMVKIGTGPLTMALAGLMNVIIGVIFILLYFVFSPLSAGDKFPFPDEIIFNKVGFFDPNFINPNNVTGAPVNILQGLIQNLYNTGFVIAGAVFVIAAMIIGIKLAVSTIASEKAHYKQALMIWITGLFLLFTTHFIMLAVFTVNEEIVNQVSNASDSIEIKVQLGEDIPLIGNAIVGLLKGLSYLFGSETTFGELTLHGYSGLLVKFAVMALSGNIVGSIICAILLGQTCAIILMYLKRLFYSIILGIVAPLIVAADVMKKSL